MNDKKILLSLDNSMSSMDAVKYVSRFFLPDQMEITLFHVLSNFPEISSVLQNHPGYLEAIKRMQSLIVSRKLKMQSFMDSAKNIFLNSGYSEESIKIIMPERKLGVAQDIAMMAQQGYDAVVLGRTVVSNKVFEIVNRQFLAYWIVDGQNDSNNIAITIDNSESSWRAVKFVTKMLIGMDNNIILLNVRNYVDRFKSNHPSYREMKNILKNAKSFLIDNGYKEDKIKIKLIRNISNRATTIIKYSQRQNIGTIAVGRRDISKFKGLFTERVSSKVIKIIRNQAVWTIS